MLILQSHFAMLDLETMSYHYHLFAKNTYNTTCKRNK